MFDGLRARSSWYLVLILGAAAVLRLHAINFGLPALNDPDELMFQMGAVRMLSGPTLNPGWFGHPGTTTIYLLAILDACVFAFGWAVGWFADARDFAEVIYGDPTWVILPGRVAMALFSVFSIFLTHRLASSLFDRRVGLAAAAFLAVNPVHVYWSQVIRTDIMAICFMLLCMLSAVRIARDGRLRDTILASVWLALAVATKWPFAIAGFAVFGAMFVRAQSGLSSWPTELRRAVLFGGLAVAFLVLVSPFLVLDYSTVLRNLNGEAQSGHLGATGDGPLFNGAWYLSGPILSGLGLAGALLAAIGCVMIARKREPAAVLGPIAVCFFFVICIQHLVWERWTLPLMPLLAVAEGLALVQLLGFLKHRLPAVFNGLLQSAILVLCCVQPALITMAHARERMHDTRQFASAWARKNIPAGSTVMVEHFGFDLLHQPWRFLFPLGKLGCVDVRGFLQDKVQYTKIDSARGGLSNVDYGTMSRDARNTCRSDFAILTQYDRYRAEQRAYPNEFEAYEALITRGRIVATIAPVPGSIGGPIVRIVSFDLDRAETTSP